MSIMDHDFKAQQVNKPHRSKSLADIKLSVQKADLPKKRKQALTTSLNTVARVLGRSLSEIPAQPASLRGDLSKASYLLAGVTKRRWTDIRSLTLKALQIGGVQLMPGVAGARPFRRPGLRYAKQSIRATAWVYPGS